MRKLLYLISMVFTLIFSSGCGPSACDCAQLLKANYNRGLFWQYGMSKDDKQKTQECMDKFDGYLNAEKECDGVNDSNEENEINNDERTSSSIQEEKITNSNQVTENIDTITPVGSDQTKIIESIVEYYMIQDPDGFSNLRESPNGTIIRKVYPNESFIIIDSSSTFMKVKFDNGETGFIHRSRVVKK